MKSFSTSVAHARTISLVFLLLIAGAAAGQTTITTTGTAYTGGSGAIGNTVITFGVNNTNPTDVQLTAVSSFQSPVYNGTTYTLWYTATALTGAPTIASPAWTAIATGSPVTVSASGITTVLSGLSFIIPAGTTYRFALQSSLGISWSGTGSITPNTFSAGGVSLYTSANPLSVGYGGTFPSPASSPRAFTGAITFVPAIPCSGTPVGGTATATPPTPCTGNTSTLNLSGATTGTGLTYQWEYFTGATWDPVVGGAGATTASYTTPPVTGTTLYRARIECTTGVYTPDYSDTAVVSTATPAYAALPYFQDFETWSSFCATSDVPSGGNVVNIPASGNSSWRRRDQGTTAAWSSATLGMWAAPLARSGTYAARFHTTTAPGSVPPNGAGAGNLDFYVNASSSADPKAAYFWYRNVPPTGAPADSLTVWVSTDGGATFAQVGGVDTAAVWKRGYVPVPSGTATTVLRFQARKWGTTDATDIGLDSLYVVPACTGAPVAGTILSDGGTLCAGTSFLLTLTGTSLAGNLQYAWQQSLDGGLTWSPAPGATGSLAYTTPVLSAPTRYRVVVTCGGSGLSDTTAAIIFNLVAPTYAALPYNEDFEAWTTRCSVSDIPADSWTNAPAAGNASWRRVDQGSTAGWSAVTTGAYTPIAASGIFSARFHSSQAAPTNTRGRLDLYLDCSPIAGTKELRFFLNNGISAAVDSLLVSYSTNAGATFLPLAGYAATAGWEAKTVSLVSNSATTVLRFEGKSALGSTDIGLDRVTVLPPCTGTPLAGTVDPVAVCAAATFTLSVTGSSAAAGLTYQWEESATGTGGWTAIGGATGPTYSAVMTAPMYYRRVTTCAASGVSAATPALFVDFAPFYFCYCASGATATTGLDIGNVRILTQPAGAAVLDNGVATPVASNPAANKTYTSFTASLGALPMFRDSLYEFRVSEISSAAATIARVGIYIDLDRNGTFDPGERVFFKTTAATSIPAWSVTDTFRIPAGAPIGITGMRVILVSGTGTSVPVCGTYANGETEDYLVELALPPCDGPPDPGTLVASDTGICPGYVLNLTDTSYQKDRSGLTRVWEVSTNAGGSWTEVAGSTNKDTLNPVITAASVYRVRMTCLYTGDTVYTNTAAVSINLPYQCYCYSIALGGPGGTRGPLDSSDATTFRIGDFMTSAGGPHLLNPTATAGRTDYSTTTQPIVLFTDTTYPVDIYQTLRGLVHQDAKVTLFMDFDNNLQYDVPRERVLTLFTTATNWYLTDSVRIPKDSIITGERTGMRLVVNNDVGPNVPSDEGCGPYTSGETEDYVVIFRNYADFAGVGSPAAAGLRIDLFPNPTDGRAVLSMAGSGPLGEVSITVTDPAGRTVRRETLAGTPTRAQVALDLSREPRGVYFVEVRAGGERMVRRVVVQ